MGPIELFISGLLVNTQPLLAFLGVGTSVVAVQLAVLAAVAVSIIGALIFSVYLISKMVSKGGKGKGLEDNDDEEPQGPLAVSEDENDLKPPKLNKKEPKPKKTAADLVEKDIDNSDIDAAINIAKAAIGPAKAALANANAADKAFTKLEQYCTEMSKACEAYHSINIDEDAEADEIAAAQTQKDQARQECVELSKNIQSIIPVVKAAYPALLIAKKDAQDAKNLVKTTASKLEKLIAIQGQACLDAQSKKSPKTLFAAKTAEFVNSSKRASEIDVFYEPLAKATDRLEKICAYSKLTLKARHEYQQVVPPKPKVMKP